MANKTYSEKLRDPRWYAKRQEILERDKHRCRYCQAGDEPEDGWDRLDLQVHHLRYFKGKEPWEYENEFLMSLCDTCHGNVTDDLEQIQKYLVMIQQIDPWRLQHVLSGMKRYHGKAYHDTMPGWYKEMTADIFKKLPLPYGEEKEEEWG